MSLEPLRARIDEIDASLLRLFQERMDVSAQIAAQKRRDGLPVYDAARERAKAKAFHDAARPPYGPYAQELYASLCALSRRYQRCLATPLRAGLLGRTLQHSFSPLIHSFFGDYSYDLFEVEPQQLESFVLSGPFDALNVTIPYKKAVLPYCGKLTARAQKAGNVNTLVRLKDGTLLGDNTDGVGFEAMVNSLPCQPAGKKVLVLGNGGASATVCSVLRAMGASEIAVIPHHGGERPENHRDAQWIVNATPCGMYPASDDAPISLDGFPAVEAVLDLVYNPARTRLLLQAQARSIVHANGLTMLVMQAYAAAERFLGRDLPIRLAEEALRAVRRSQENIVLVGMPGCGKTTVGRLLAQKTGRAFFDADELLCERLGMDLPQYLRTHPEAAFRDAEAGVLAAVGKRSGIVLATGGGCVLRAQNIASLKQNGRVIFLERALEKLPTQGRPLSQAGDLGRMYRRRLPLYLAFADARAANDGTLQEAVDNVLEAYDEVVDY